jgi:hypothetical protein
MWTPLLAHLEKRMEGVLGGGDSRRNW